MVRRRTKHHHIRHVVIPAPYKCGPDDFLHRIHQCGCWCGNDVHVLDECTCCPECLDADCPGCEPIESVFLPA